MQGNYIDYLDFAGLKEHYHTILHLMPNYYQPTIAKLQDCISDDQICVILSSGNSTDANKIILDCLIERMKYRKDLLVLCDQLESIITSHEAKILINKIRSGQMVDTLFPKLAYFTRSSAWCSVSSQYPRPY